MNPDGDQQNTLQLPLSIVSQTDLARLAREIESIDEAIAQSSLRPGGTKQMPRLSRLLDEFVRLNQLELLQIDDYKRAKRFFADMSEHAPRIHMSFAVDPSAKVIEKVITWLRTEVHPLVLLQTGLQPDIGAGFVLRTPNRSIDCSLHQNFANSREQLVQALQGEAS